MEGAFIPLFMTGVKDPRAVVTAHRLVYYISLYIATLPLSDRAAFLQFLRMYSVEISTMRSVMATERELRR